MSDELLILEIIGEFLVLWCSRVIEQVLEVLQEFLVFLEEVSVVTKVVPGSSVVI